VLCIRIRIILKSWIRICIKLKNRVQVNIKVNQDADQSEKLGAVEAHNGAIVAHPEAVDNHIADSHYLSEEPDLGSHCYEMFDPNQDPHRSENRGGFGSEIVVGTLHITLSKQSAGHCLKVRVITVICLKNCSCF
jgi:hypothetical protein